MVTHAVMDDTTAHKWFRFFHVDIFIQFKLFASNWPMGGLDYLFFFLFFSFRETFTNQIDPGCTPLYRRSGAIKPTLPYFRIKIHSNSANEVEAPLGIIKLAPRQSTHRHPPIIINYWPGHSHHHRFTAFKGGSAEHHRHIMKIC